MGPVQVTPEVRHVNFAREPLRSHFDESNNEVQFL